MKLEYGQSMRHMGSVQAMRDELGAAEHLVRAQLPKKGYPPDGGNVVFEVTPDEGW